MRHNDGGTDMGVYQSYRNKTSLHFLLQTGHVASCCAATHLDILSAKVCGLLVLGFQVQLL